MIFCRGMHHARHWFFALTFAIVGMGADIYGINLKLLPHEVMDLREVLFSQTPASEVRLIRNHDTQKPMRFKKTHCFPYSVQNFKFGYRVRRRERSVTEHYFVDHAVAVKKDRASH